VTSSTIELVPVIDVKKKQYDQQEDERRGRGKGETHPA
jgi:hypothetical protein